VSRKRRATMQDIARVAGVSRTTVSFVLNDIPDANIPDVTRQRVLQVARELDYTPNAMALNLARGKAMTVGLIVRQTAEQLSIDAFLGQVILGVMRVIEAQGFHLIIHAVDASASGTETYVELVRTRKVDGLVISSPLANDPEIKLLHDEGTPIVVHGAADIPDVPSVDVDNVQGAYIAVKHLLDLGHRRIGHITNTSLRYTSSRDRLKGYRQALDDAGIAYDNSLVFEGEFTDLSGANAMHRLLDMPNPPTAVFIGSDLVALGAIGVVHERGLRIPDDISVIGFDDLMFSQYLQPPLTTMHLPPYDLGRRCGETVLSIIRGELPTSQRLLLPTEIRVRGSTAPLR
jgi:DNA-binding LacI/PurR family transcriptional regulator